MPVDRRSLKQVYVRAVWASLAACLGISLLEVVWFQLAPARSGALTLGQRAEMMAFTLGTIGSLGLLLGLIEGGAVVAIEALENKLETSSTRVLLLVIAALLVCSPLALFASAFAPRAAAELVAMAALVAVGGLLVLTTGRWRSRAHRWFPRPLLLVVVCGVAVFVVFHQVESYMLLARLRSPPHASLALRYYLVLLGVGGALMAGLYQLSTYKLGDSSLARARRGPALDAAVALVGTLLAAVIYRVDATYLVRQYEEFHLLLEFCMYVCAQVSVVSAHRALRQRPRYESMARAVATPVVAVTGVVLLVGLQAFTFVRLGASERLTATAMEDLPVLAQAVRFERWLVDFDRDGHSALLGGGDCNDWDASIGPTRQEVVDNGIDDNCFGGDLTRAALDARGDRLLADRRRITAWWATHPARPSTRFNVVIISVDTLRADHLGFWGYHREVSPNIDALARRSVAFVNAYTQGGWTSLAIPALMKGLHPSEIDFTPVFEDTDQKGWLRDEVPASSMVVQVFTVPAFDRNDSLAQILERAGYATVAVVADEETNYFQRKFGFLHGFDRAFHDNPGGGGGDDSSVSTMMTAERVTDFAVTELDRVASGEPFFFWLHYYDPHLPLRDTRFDRWRRTRIDAYDGEVGQVDHEVGRFIDALRVRGLEERTIIVFTADHGEAFGEHGVGGHGLTGHQAEIQVPLLLNVPGFSAQVVEEAVGTIDIVPTLLDLLSIDTDHRFSGRSLLPLVFDMPGFEPREVLSQTWRYDLSGNRYLSIKTLLMGHHKLMYDETDLYFTMYDLQADPGETVNIADDRPELFETMRQILMSYVERDRRVRIDAPPAK